VLIVAVGLLCVWCAFVCVFYLPFSFCLTLSILTTTLTMPIISCCTYVPMRVWLYVLTQKRSAWFGYSEPLSPRKITTGIDLSKRPSSLKSTKPQHRVSFIKHLNYMYRYCDS